MRPASIVIPRSASPESMAGGAMVRRLDVCPAFVVT